MTLQKSGSFVSPGFCYPLYSAPKSIVLSSSTQLSFSTQWVPLFLSSWSLLQNCTSTACSLHMNLLSTHCMERDTFLFCHTGLTPHLLALPCLHSYIIWILLLRSSYLRPPFLRLSHLLALLLALSSSDLSLIPLMGSSLSLPLVC